jgi:hypothetical protein
VLLVARAFRYELGQPVHVRARHVQLYAVDHVDLQRWTESGRYAEDGHADGLHAGFPADSLCPDPRLQRVHHALTWAPGWPSGHSLQPSTADDTMNRPPKRR